MGREPEPEPEPEPETESTAKASDSTSDPAIEAGQGVLKDMLAASGVTVHFMHGSVETALKKAKYKNTFDLAYVSSFYAHEISHEVLQATLKPGARFITETCRFVLELT